MERALGNGSSGCGSCPTRSPRKGYQLVVGELAGLVAGPDAVDLLGNFSYGVAVCAGDVIVCPDDCWDYAYSVSHEIAEQRQGFQHTNEMFAEQANLLARWLKRVTFLAERALSAGGQAIEAEPTPAYVVRPNKRS